MVCGLTKTCRHSDAAVRFGEMLTPLGGWWTHGECGEVLNTVLDGIMAGEFARANASTWTRAADNGWDLDIDGKQFSPAHSQTIKMEGDRPVQITLRTGGAQLAATLVRSVTWTVDYVRASVANRSLDLPARSVFVVEYLSGKRVSVRSAFSDYGMFQTSSRLLVDAGARK